MSQYQYKFELEPLGYEFNDLEPYLDAETMQIHHDGHYQAYADKLNAAIGDYDELKSKSARELISNLDLVPEKIRLAVKNSGGGYVNHSFFWSLLKKDVPFDGEVAEKINQTFGNYNQFKEEFLKSANSLFGSGWTWLVVNGGELEIMNTANQDSPLSQNKIPILVIDLWEHAYYLKYRNKRVDYIDNFFKVINWDQVNKNYEEAKK